MLWAPNSSSHLLSYSFLRSSFFTCCLFFFKLLQFYFNFIYYILHDNHHELQVLCLDFGSYGFCRRLCFAFSESRTEHVCRWINYFIFQFNIRGCLLCVLFSLWYQCSLMKVSWTNQSSQTTPQVITSLQVILQRMDHWFVPLIIYDIHERSKLTCL